MSVRVLAKVWEFFDGGGSDLLAMLALADWSDDTGKCFPAIDSVAKKIRLSPTQSRRIVHGLIDSGHLIVLENERGGRGATRVYQIDLARLKPRIGERD